MRLLKQSNCSDDFKVKLCGTHLAKEGQDLITQEMGAAGVAPHSTSHRLTFVSPNLVQVGQNLQGDIVMICIYPCSLRVRMLACSYTHTQFFFT